MNWSITTGPIQFLTVPRSMTYSRSQPSGTLETVGINLEPVPELVESDPVSLEIYHVMMDFTGR